MLSNFALLTALVFVQDTLTPAERTELFRARESVWRSFFSNDRATLERLIPEEAVVMDAGTTGMGSRQSVLEGASQFARGGAKLMRLEFPRTEIQRYGSVAILYSTYVYELEERGKRTPFSGRITEIFVFRQGHWINPGWHMEPAK